MSLTMLLWFALTEFFLALTPGPAVLLVVAHGMQYGARPSVWGTLGILSVEVVYFAVSAVGVGAVLVTSTLVFQAMKWSGAAYLVYLGIRMLCTTTFTGAANKTTPPAAGHVLFVQGVITQLANPKALLFFTALLPQFIDPAGSIMWQCVMLGVTSILIEFPVLVGYGWVAEQSKQVMQHRRWARWLDRLAGIFLISAGVKLALERRA
jgi:homoserine/homoserine lactone efflux protein